MRLRKDDIDWIDTKEEECSNCGLVFFLAWCIRNYPEIVKEYKDTDNTDLPEDLI